MGLEDAYRKLMERQRELQEKLTELAGLAEEVVRAQHQFRRVEMETLKELNQALDATWEDYTHARRRFERALQGD
ncbi:MAG: hypothetical protein V3R29_07905 [Candidatus Acidoferrales bacterium]